MPLLDHFHPPLAPLHHWESFHARWTTSLADALNPQLSDRYFAEPQTHYGNVTTLPVSAWAPPTPALSMPWIRPESFEVLVFHDTDRQQPASFLGRSTASHNI